MRSAIGLILVLGCGAPAPTSSPPARREAPPDLAELRTLLAAQAQRRFTADDVERGCPADQTLGEYLALLEANTRTDPHDPSAIVALDGGCAPTPPTTRHGALDPLWPPEDDASWLCHVDAFASDAAGESPWHYELRVRVRRDDRGLDPSWLSCPGLP